MGHRVGVAVGGYDTLEAIGVFGFAAVFDPEPRIEFVSLGLAGLLGLLPQEIIRDPQCVVALMEPAQRAAFEADWHAALERLEGPLEIAFTTGDGRKVLLRQCSRVTRDAEGTPVRVDGVARDVTSLTELTHALRHSEDRYLALLHSAPIGVVIYRWGELIEVNTAARAMLGIPAEIDSSEIDAADFLAPGEATRLEQLMQQHARGEYAPSQFEIDVIDRTGSDRRLLVGVEPVMVDGIPATMVAFSDITARKRAEDELKASRAQFQRIIEIAPEGLYVERDGVVLFANPACLAMVGASSMDALVGNPINTWLESEHTQQAPAESPAPGAATAWERVRPIRFSGDRCLERALLSGDYLGLMTRFGLVRDVTESVRAHERLQQRLRYEGLVSQLAAGFINAPAADIADEIARALAAIGGVAEADRCFVTELEPGTFQVVDGHEWTREGVIAFPDVVLGVCYEDYPYAGSTMLEHGALHVPSVQNLPPEAAPEKTLFEKQSVQSTLVLPLYADGLWRGFFGMEMVTRQRTWSDDEIEALKLAAQVFSYALSRKHAEAERQALEVQRNAAQKLESLGVLVGGIAHDFNNLLTGIMGNASLVLEDLPPNAAPREAIADIETAARHAAQLVRQMLAYAGKGKADKQLLDLGQVVRDIGQLLRTVVSKKAVLTFDHPPDPVFIYADESQVRQVIMNLLTNASQALEDQPGAITVRIGLAAIATSRLRRAFLGEEATPGDFAFVSVEDTGSGIPPDTMARMFDPFFTSRPSGTGLGLAATLGIMRGHGGVIEVDTTVGRGSSFRVFFPASPAHTSTLRRRDGVGETEAVPLPPSGLGRVLVVDDEPAVRGVARRILERAGYTVLEAENGREGVTVFEAERAALIAIVLDMAMPEMDGREAFSRMRANGDAVPTVFSSGFVPKAELDQLLKAPGTAFVPKPYRPAALVDAIAALIAG